MCLDKVTWNIHSLSAGFFKIFTTVAIIFHSITPVKGTSLDVIGSGQCKQTIIFVRLLIHTYIFKSIFCFCEVYLFIRHQSATVNSEIALRTSFIVVSDKRLFREVGSKLDKIHKSCSQPGSTLR